MRLLVVHPGATYATGDVHTGIVDALKRKGIEIVLCALDGRIQRSGEFLNLLWEQAGKDPANIPLAPDVIYHASQGILERALRFDVDATLIISGMFVHPDFMVLMQRAGQRSAILLTESPYDDDEQARILPYFEAAWTNERTSLTGLRTKNPQVSYLAAAYDPARHHHREGEDEALPDGLEPASHDVVFVGSGFQERVALLEATDWTGIDFGLYGQWDLAEDSPLREHLRSTGPIRNAETVALYRRAKIGLNLHRTSIGYGESCVGHITYAESMNPRCYELAASGLFFVSDYRKELAERLPAVPTFDGPTNLRTLLCHYLQRPQDRARIARENEEAIRPHTFDARADVLIEGLLRIIGQPADQPVATLHLV